MLTLQLFIRGSTLALFTVALLGASGSLARQADAPGTISAQLSALSGHGLRLAGCQERLLMLGSLLAKAGYGPMRSHLLGGTTKVARWYHPGRRTTILAVAGWEPEGNAFSVGEVAGPVRWNELAGTPW